MANTNLDIKPLKDRKHFKQRQYENNRQKNINGNNDKFINIVEIINDKIGQKDIIEKKEIEPLKRSDLTRLIASYNAKVKKCNNELNQLNMKYYECDSDLEKDKIKKKIDKKKDSLNNFKEKIKDFEFLKKQTPSKKANHKKDNRNEFYELRFSITNPPKRLRRNIDYGKDFLNVVKDYLKEKGISIDIHSFSLHMDQHSPHVHMLGSIKNQELTLNQQLEKIFDKRFSFHSLQKDFNNFVKNHDLIKKHDLKLGEITRGGAYEYEKNLLRYKANQKDIEKKVEQQISSIKPKRNLIGLVVESREQKLENIAKQLLIEKNSHKQYSKNIEKDLIRSDKIISNVLSEKQNEKYNKEDLINNLKNELEQKNEILKDFDKHVDIAVDKKFKTKAAEINKVFSEQKNKIQKQDSHIEKLEAKLKEYELNNDIDR